MRARSWRLFPRFAAATLPRRIGRRSKSCRRAIRDPHLSRSPIRSTHCRAARGGSGSINDPRLNQLEQQLTAENPNLAAMAEQYTQARDMAAEARAGLSRK